MPKNIEKDLVEKFKKIMQRYGGSTPEAFVEVLCPILVPIKALDKSIFKESGQGHFRASFEVEITSSNRTFLQPGRTGKFVPNDYNIGGLWKEVAKGRILEVDEKMMVAYGEVYTGGNSKADIQAALNELTADDFLEIDQFGAAAKVLSGLAEYYLVERSLAKGYVVKRMPEDMAKHIGCYCNYDFIFEKNGVAKKIEVKSLWGTNTKYARLIHSTTKRPAGDPKKWTLDQQKNYYPTSSCKFETQDILAVNLFLRTGNIGDFAFARSVPADKRPYGLPRCNGFPEHIHQNPVCEIDNKIWFPSIDDVWSLK